MRFPSVVYALCLASSLVCTVLLIRSYSRGGMRLLLWCALGFVGLAASNFMLFLDVVLLPGIDLRIWRNGTALIGVAVMLYGFVWEVD